jgi:hypothetical protein
MRWIPAGMLHCVALPASTFSTPINRRRGNPPPPAFSVADAYSMVMRTVFWLASVENLSLTQRAAKGDYGQVGWSIARNRGLTSYDIGASCCILTEV